MAKKTPDPADSGKKAPQLEVTPAARDKARKLYEAAQQAVMKKNYDYAVDMCKNACRLEPNNLAYRQWLRATERQKFKSEGVKPKAFAFGFGVKLALMKAMGRWRKIMNMCEDVLAKDPWHRQAQMALGEACHRFGLLNMAIWVMTTMLQEDSEHPPALRQAGRYFEEAGGFNQAIECWQQVHRLVPIDQEADARVKDLSANETIRRGHLDEAESYRESVRDLPQAEKMEAELRMSHTERQMRERIEQLLGQLGLEPNNASLYQSMGDLYTRVGDLDEAEKAFEKGMELSDGDFTFHMAIADIHVRRMRHAIQQTEKQLAEDPDNEEAQATRQKMLQELNAFELKEYQARREHYPTDLDIRYELAVRLYQAGRFDDAIKEFQTARRNPKKRFRAMDYLGRCFARQGAYDLALTQFQEALTAMAVGDEEAEKDLRYHMMVVAKKAGEEKIYADNLKRLAALDYSYKDVAERLKKLQGSKSQPNA